MYTPAQIVAASSLTNNTGLGVNTAMIALCSTISSNQLVSNYSSMLPGTANGNVLAANGFSVTSLNLPLFVANANSAVTSITTQANKTFPNVATFAGVLSIAGTFATTAYTLNKAVSDLNSQTFDSLSLSISDHQSSTTNGISTIFGGSATSPAEVKSNMNAIADAIENFGTAYSVTNLGKLDDPVVFVKNLLDQGFDIPGPVDSPTDPWYYGMSNAEVRGYLDELVGPVLNRVISQTGIKIPEGSAILSLGELLDLNKVVPARVLALIPGENFAGLSNMFLNLGGKFKSFKEIASLLRATEVPELPSLNTMSQPVSDTVKNNLQAQIGIGSGTYGNPTLVDLLGAVTGIPYRSNLSTIASSLSTVTSITSGQNLLASFVSLTNAIATGNPTFISSNIASLQSSASTFNADPVVTSQTSANSGVSYALATLQTEKDNLTKAGVDLTNFSASSPVTAIGIATSLHDFGVDANQLGYAALLESMAQPGAGGEAILAALAEGRNMRIQSQFSIPNLSKSSL